MLALTLIHGCSYGSYLHPAFDQPVDVHARAELLRIAHRAPRGKPLHSYLHLHLYLYLYLYHLQLETSPCPPTHAPACLLIHFLVPCLLASLTCTPTFLCRAYLPRVAHFAAGVTRLPAHFLTYLLTGCWYNVSCMFIHTLSLFTHSLRYLPIVPVQNRYVLVDTYLN